MKRRRLSIWVRRPRLVLAVCFGVAAFTRMIIALQSRAPMAMTDELLYMRLARSAFELGLFGKAGELANFPFALYPALLSPLLLLPPMAIYTAVKAVNAL